MAPLGPWQIKNLVCVKQALLVKTAAELRGDNKAGNASVSERASQETFQQHHGRTF